MEWGQYILIGFFFACLFFAGAAWALHWAHKHGQLSNLDEGSKSIFDEDEPLGEVTDTFPIRSRKRRGRQSGPGQGDS